MFKLLKKLFTKQKPRRNGVSVRDFYNETA